AEGAARTGEAERRQVGPGLDRGGLQVVQAGAERLPVDGGPNERLDLGEVVRDAAGQVDGQVWDAGAPARLEHVVEVPAVGGLGVGAAVGAVAHRHEDVVVLGQRGVG